MPPKYADLRDENKFPKFADLPTEDDVDPSRILLLIRWGRLHTAKALAKDKTGEKLRVAFYTDRKGLEWKTPNVKPGYTVAILYPYNHPFLDRSTGVRLEESDTIKLIPSSLDNLFRLNDYIQSPFFDNARGCHGCEQEKESLNKCAGCGSVWYCNKECQSVGWKEKGHKADCKVLRDPDFKGMLEMNWSHFDGERSFPLSN